MQSTTQSATNESQGVTFYVEEGNFTRNEEMDTDEGMKRGGAFVSPGKKGLEVQIYASADKTVAPLTTGIPMGRLMERPKGNLPRSTLTSGNYPRRKAKVELYGELDWVQLADTHGAVTPGTYLAVDRTDPSLYVIEEDTTTNIIAMETRAENETGNILVFRRGPVQRAAD